MAGNIVYIQANDTIADSFRKTFSERNIELIIAKSAAEAIEKMKSLEVDVLLVDINIPDMRLSKLVEICTRDFPGVILNVCVDVMNSLLVTKLVNRHAIRKIFVAPWDVNEMVEEIEESLDAARIAREEKIYENRVKRENEQFEETLSSLTRSLKRQQYSYNTIKKITDVILSDLVLLNKDLNRTEQDKIKFVFDTYLRMQTVDAIDIDAFENLLRTDMDKMEKSYPGFSCTEIISCLIGGVPKACAANIRFFIWLIAMYNARIRNNCEYLIDSQFMSVTKAVFILTAKGKITRSEDMLDKYVALLMNKLCESVSITNETATGEDTMVYNLEFTTVAESE